MQHARYVQVQLKEQQSVPLAGGGGKEKKCIVLRFLNYGATTHFKDDAGRRRRPLWKLCCVVGSGPKLAVNHKGVSENGDSF